jgi:NAD(P)-dependent dehydrogenase (short-subunit alcohol dehydrogenase family)
VNNAGGSRLFPEGSASIPDEEWQDSFTLNLFPAIRLTNAVLPALRASKAAAVVNISSAAATMPFAPCAHYGAAKAALDFYSRALAVELAPSVRVNVVTPVSSRRRAATRCGRRFRGFRMSGSSWCRSNASAPPTTSRRSSRCLHRIAGSG